MEALLDNPVYNAMISEDQHLAFGTDRVKYFNEEVSPFAGFEQENKEGFEQLHDLLPTGRKILYATPVGSIGEPKGWQVVQQVGGLQFVYDSTADALPTDFQPVPLTDQHIDEMVALATLTKPGPFGTGTIRFGHYYGVFENNKLVAMTGQRLHLEGYTEISAVCTHPDHLGKGYARQLVPHQTQLILQQSNTPYLHVRDDNSRAIDIYQRLGFKLRGPMHFYFMKRQ